MISSDLLIARVRTLPSLIILLAPHLVSLPGVPFLLRPIKRWTADLVPLDSLVSADPPSPAEKEMERKNRGALWRQIVLVSLGAVEMSVWMGVLGSQIQRLADGTNRPEGVVLTLAMVLVWVSPLTPSR